jgi:hypothetical protein
METDEDGEPKTYRYEATVKIIVCKYTKERALETINDMMRGHEMMTDNFYIDSVEEIPE